MAKHPLVDRVIAALCGSRAAPLVAERPSTTPIAARVAAAAPPPADARASVTREAVAEYERLRAGYRPEEDRFKEMVHPSLWDWYLTLCEQHGEVEWAYRDLLVAELGRHLPGVAPVLPMLAQHILDTPLDRVGTCCADGEAPDVR